ncbi:MAG: cupin domain-containing protein [Desulfobacteraceae bacterium]|nr:cupin domain-containing protein [Desulfobacteraceae bacterium]
MNNHLNPLLTKDQLIKKHGLIAHPEGGYYKEVFRSKERVSSPIHHLERNAVTHIYFLLGKSDISRFHKVLHDEIWNFYDGAPIRLVKFDNQHVTEDIIGPNCSEYVCIIKGGSYQAAESTGDYTLVGCTVSPGFDFSDFSFLKDNKKDLKRFDHFHFKYKKFL